MLVKGATATKVNWIIMGLGCLWRVTPSRYLNQCWYIVISAHGNRILINLTQMQNWFFQGNVFKMSSFCFGLSLKVVIFVIADENFARGNPDPAGAAMGPAHGGNNPVQNIPANYLQGPQNPQGGPPTQMQGVVAHPIVSFVVVVVVVVVYF